MRRLGLLAPTLLAVVVLAGCGASKVGTIDEFALHAHPGPFGIAAGSDGRVWFASAGGAIGAVTMDGHITQYVAGLRAGDTPEFITAGRGSTWFTSEPDRGPESFGRVSHGGSITTYPGRLHPNAGVSGIVQGPDGVLWIAEMFASSIGKVSPSGKVLREFRVSPGLHPGYHDGPFSLALVGGDVWFTERVSDVVGRLSRNGKVTEYKRPLGSVPNGIVLGPDRNVWVTEWGADRILRITPNGKVTDFHAGITRGSKPAFITAGSDGNLWFTEEHGGIGRITPRGKVTEFRHGLTRNGWPEGITAGPDGNIWFTEWRVGKIGRLRLH